MIKNLPHHWLSSRLDKRYLMDLLRQFLAVAALGGVATFFIFGDPSQLYHEGGWTLVWSIFWKNGVAAAILWIGNGLLTEYWDQKISWVEKPVLRFWVSMATTVGFTAVAWLLIVWLHMFRHTGWNILKVFRWIEMQSFLPTLLITFFISLFLHGRAFLMEWKNAVLEAERLKKEQATARYETLKNQVNPHFLFNSLNVLSSLVHIDANRAEAFIRRLSSVYRYILESRDQDLATLKEELDILRSYFFLMDVRFGEALQTQIAIAPDAKGYIAPLTLQMLAENALKHNEVSKVNPLKIDIYLEGNDYIVVKNNVQPKNILPDSTGVGLDNIRARYDILSDLPLTISNDGRFFIVKIPILSIGR